MDVKNSFLQGELKEGVYMQNPPRVTSKSHPYMICHLKKPLYIYLVMFVYFLAIHVSHRIFITSKCNVPSNVGVTFYITFTRSIHRRCPLSALLFAITTHPLLVMLSRLATNGDTHIPSRLAIDNDSICVKLNCIDCEVMVWFGV